MSDSSEEIIIDQPEKVRTKTDYFLLALISISLLGIGLILSLFEAKLYYYFAGAGFLGMSIRYLLLFFREKQSLSDWFYMLGRIGLLVGIGAFIVFSMYTPYVMIPAMIFFFLGIVTSKKED